MARLEGETWPPSASRPHLTSPRGRGTGSPRRERRWPDSNGKHGRLWRPALTWPLPVGAETGAPTMATIRREAWPPLESRPHLTSPSGREMGATKMARLERETWPPSASCPHLASPSGSGTGATKMARLERGTWPPSARRPHLTSPRGRGTGRAKDGQARTGILTALGQPPSSATASAVYNADRFHCTLCRPAGPPMSLIQIRVLFGLLGWFTSAWPCCSRRSIWRSART